MFKKRRGSLLVTAISLVAVLLTTSVGVVVFLENSSRQAKNDKWELMAADAARSGLAFVLGWAEANIDKNTRLPVDWEMRDGEVKNPLLGFLNSASGDKVRAKSRALASQVQGPAEIIDQNGVCEYVLGRYGNYIVSFKVRIQQFRVSENHPRQYKIGVAGRVREAKAIPSEPALMTDERFGLVAERVILATVGKEPFSKYAALIDTDLVKNWVPGEIVDGPLHINRGYWDEGQTALDRRSKMILQVPGSFTAATPGGVTYPIFQDEVTMAMDDTTTPQDDTVDGTTAIEVKGSGSGPISTMDPTLSRKMFRAAVNQSVWKGISGPKKTGKVEMPRSSAARLGEALGLPAGRSIVNYDWFNLSNMPDGLYIPTVNAVNNYNSFQYNPTAAGDGFAAGGIYIRGNVEVMRTAVVNNFSYYFFQLGYGHPDSRRRCYMVRVDRFSKQILLKAWAATGAGLPSTTTLASLGYDLSVLEQTSGFTPQTDPKAFSLEPGGGNAKVYITLPAMPTTYSRFPFNGIVFVDVSKYDPIRPAGTDPTVRKPLTAPTTGNIMSLGNPGVEQNSQVKTPYTQVPNPVGVTGADAAAIRSADQVCTEDATSTVAPRPASKLSIITAGHIFLQNHLMLSSIPDTSKLDPNRLKVLLSTSKDLIGLVADRQVVAGALAPSATTRTSYGTVIHASIAALGDPSFKYTTNSVDPTEMYGNKAFRGSFATEGLMQLFAPQGTLDEPYEMVYSASGTAPLTSANVYRGESDNYPGNPLYRTWYQDKATFDKDPNRLGTRGRLLVFGSVSMKKRGAIGVGNISYDKDFRYDGRLQSIAPPLFPVSTNMILKATEPTQRTDMPYWTSGHLDYGTGPTHADMDFMGEKGD